MAEKNEIDVFEKPVNTHFTLAVVAVIISCFTGFWTIPLALASLILSLRTQDLVQGGRSAPIGLVDGIIWLVNHFDCAYPGAACFIFRRSYFSVFRRFDKCRVNVKIQKRPGLNPGLF